MSIIHKRLSLFNRRNWRGQATLEMAPALLLVLVITLFPLMDLLYLGFIYFGGQVLNSAQLEAAVLVPQGSATSAVSTVASQWQSQGSFLLKSASTSTSVSYSNTSDATSDVQCTVTTKVTASPLLPIPFMGSVPGLSSPITFTYTSSRILETPSSSSS
jgi:hypothetical protein